MLGIDTNVLVRFLVRDEERQFARAQRLLRREAERGEPVFVSHLVLLETEWVLRSRYGLSKAQILGAFCGLLESTELQIEGEPSVEQALFIWRDSTAEFAELPDRYAASRARLSGNRVVRTAGHQAARFHRCLRRASASTPVACRRTQELARHPKAI